MQWPDNDIEFHSDFGPTIDEPVKSIDFTVDSAGNVSPLMKRKAASVNDRPPPKRDQWRRSG